MTSMSQNSEEMLEFLKKQFKLKTGEDLSEDELIQKCIQAIYQNSDILFKETSLNSTLTKEKLERIISSARDDMLYDEDKSDDELIYGL